MPVLTSGVNTMTCIQLQIICDGDPQVLDTFDIFEDCMKHGSFWPVSLICASYCIWQVDCLLVSSFIYPGNYEGLDGVTTD